MPEGGHEERDRLIVVDTLMIAPCLAHCVRAVVALQTDLGAPQLNHVVHARHGEGLAAT